MTDAVKQRKREYCIGAYANIQKKWKLIVRLEYISVYIFKKRTRCHYSSGALKPVHETMTGVIIREFETQAKNNKKKNEKNENNNNNNCTCWMLKEEEEDMLAGGACVRRNECWCKLQLWMPKSCYFTPEMFTSILSPICNSSRRNRESRDFSSYRLARIVNSKSVGPRPRCYRIKYKIKNNTNQID